MSILMMKGFNKVFQYALQGACLFVIVQLFLQNIGF